MAGAAAFTTDRLTARRPAAADDPAYAELLLDPRVSAWLRPPPLAPLQPGDPPALLRRDAVHWRRHRFGPCALVETASGVVVGRGGLAWTTVQGERVVELPWALRPDRWGRGLATEAAQGALRWAAELGLGAVVALTQPANAASLRVMEKIGLERVGEVPHAGLAHVLYRCATATR